MLCCLHSIAHSHNPTLISFFSMCQIANPVVWRVLHRYLEYNSKEKN